MLQVAFHGRLQCPAPSLGKLTRYLPGSRMVILAGSDGGPGCLLVILVNILGSCTVTNQGDWRGA